MPGTRRCQPTQRLHATGAEAEFPHPRPPCLPFTCPGRPRTQSRPTPNKRNPARAERQYLRSREPRSSTFPGAARRRAPGGTPAAVIAADAGTTEAGTAVSAVVAVEMVLVGLLAPAAGPGLEAAINPALGVLLYVTSWR